MSREDFEVFKEIKRERALNTAARREEFGRYYDEGRLPGWRRCHETHYQYRLLGDVLDFWPGRGTFRWRGRTYHDIKVMPFIKEREKSDESDNDGQV